MAQAPEWTEDEFRLLLTAYGIPDEELAARMPRRNVGGIKMVRGLVHSYHEGADCAGMLSQMVFRELERGAGELTCPACGEQF